jgi:hypothetical protein
MINLMRVTAILVTCLLTVCANAFGLSCGTPPTTVYPKSTHISPEPVIMVESHGKEGEIITECIDKRRLYLESIYDVIELRLVDKKVNDLKVQYFLRAEKALKTGLSYQIRIDNTSLSMNPNKELYRSWIVANTDAKTISKPTPRLINSSFSQGLNTCYFHSMFFVAENSNLELVCEVEILNVLEEHTGYALLSVEKDGSIFMRTSGCRGNPYKFLPSTVYQIRFRLFNLANNTKGEWSDFIELTTNSCS